MSNVPAELKYTKSHEWVRLEDDGSVTVGITDHAQAALGDLVYVEAPEVGQSFGAGDACAVVESVKAASDIYSPVAGEIIEAHDVLADEPEHVNEDPYGEGWLFKLQPENADDLGDLLDAAGYQKVIDEE
ncbi:glycine cleavage system protein GcvH [Natronospira bacteriovora]|uniref:Glycine cleavage system H protein n=1 Tax=Natronospira bacteriovora TaxID=3069753 RepID=A0ABU0W8T6_9GAMM|nr:glycine cleavage system protein GcvH [Natronospira sp. AB-CW4]MDQ2070449.1 glycine cleavage system protein GcvH [Natronospira sp. AB-CW4]